MELLKEFWEKIRSGIRVIMNYFFIIVGMAVFFTLGYYYNTLRELPKMGKPNFIMREEVTIAVDESNNVMIINKKDGTYFVLEGEIGKTIFDVKARNLWGQHNAPATPTTPTK